MVADFLKYKYNFFFVDHVPECFENVLFLVECPVPNDQQKNNPGQDCADEGAATFLNQCPLLF